MFYRLIQTVALSLLLLRPAAAQAGEAVTWAKTDFPPVRIMEGPDAGQGYGDLTWRYFAERMPEFRHQELEMSIDRIVAMMQTRDGVCDATMFKTPEREQVIMFSDQVYWVQSNRIILLKDNLEKFRPHITSAGTVDLETLVSDPAITGVVVRGRAYTPQIDDAIQGLLGTPWITQVTETAQMFKMLETSRADWIAGYAFEAGYHFGQMGQGSRFMSYSARGDTPVIPGYFACSKGPLGRKVIERVNSLIAAAGNPPRYLDYYRAWLDDQAISDLGQILLAAE